MKASARALGTAGALALAAAFGYAVQPAAAVAAPVPDCLMKIAPTPIPPTSMARGHLVPV